MTEPATFTPATLMSLQFHIQFPFRPRELMPCIVACPLPALRHFLFFGDSCLLLYRVHTVAGYAYCTQSSLLLNPNSTNPSIGVHCSENQYHAWSTQGMLSGRVPSRLTSFHNFMLSNWLTLSLWLSSQAGHLIFAPHLHGHLVNVLWPFIAHLQ